MAGSSDRSTVRRGGVDLRSLAGSDLYRSIMSADLPEQVVRALPPQTVFRALVQHGIESSTELLHIAPERHYRFFLDMRLWERDSFVEDHWWEWLQTVDLEGSLEPLEKFVRSIDPRILALVMRRHVQTVVFEDPTEHPPDAGYYTPDNGYTWVGILIPDAGQHRLLARLLAYVFQTRPELFYQLINAASQGTGIEFEEEAYQERLRRLRDEGIPDFETAAKIVSPLPPDLFLKMLEQSERPILHEMPETLAPFVAEAGALEPLASLVADVSRDVALISQLEAELSLLGNCAVVTYCENLGDSEQAERVFASLRGALNIGLEEAFHRSEVSPVELYRRVGLQPLFRLGMWTVRELRKKARQLSGDRPLAHEDPRIQALVEALEQDFPVLPRWFGEHGQELQTDRESERYRPIERRSEIAEAEAALDRLRH